MSNLSSLFRVKPLEHEHTNHAALKPCLTTLDLTTLGVGAIIGAGIFVLTGIVAATVSGPAVIFSFIVAGIACIFSALAYAELASSIGGCGSAYGYSFASSGELVAWIIGWVLLLEYSMASSAVAIGWSGYVNNALSAIGFGLPHFLMATPLEGGLMNLPAIIIIALMTYLLAIGVKESVRINKIMVFIKIFIVLIFIFLACFHFHPSENWSPFMPFGFFSIFKGAGLVFFAYIGFDAVSTAAEESVNPKKDLPKGIIYSLVICTILYILVSALLTGAVHYSFLNVSSPVSYALLHLGYRFGGVIVALGAIVGLSTTILVMFYGLTRIFFAITRDGLLPQSLAHINPNTQTPVRIIVLSGFIMAVVAGFYPLKGLAQVVNMGTLAAFALVCGSVIWMRYKKPDMPRPFKTPFSPLIPLLGALCCIYLMLNLDLTVWRNFFIWIILGLIIYFGYGRSRSILSETYRDKGVPFSPAK